MILVIGGRASGKRTFAKSLGYSDSDISSDRDCGAAALTEAQELVRADGVCVEELAAHLAARYEVVLFTEVGSGIVPLERAEREFRDKAGLLGRLLAQEATTVVRMVCGIPVALKGELPTSTGAKGEV